MPLGSGMGVFRKGGLARRRGGGVLGEEGSVGATRSEAVFPKGVLK